ncbi:MAG: hypothetical protein AAGG50_01410 [Bacteroidota bacterium]
MRRSAPVLPSRSAPLWPAVGLALCAVLLALAACDTGFEGDPVDNQPPETALAVRSDDLRGPLSFEETFTGTPGDSIFIGSDTLIVGDDGTVLFRDTLRLTSTVPLAWTGTDPDGFVDGYELRFFALSEPLGDEEGWRFTERTDSLVLLPIPFGEAQADVALEVRAIDNEGVRDPSPARTVFPIRNSDPTLRLSTTDAPPVRTEAVVVDTLRSFPLFSFGWTAGDPDGENNLAAIEVSLNDSLNFVQLPADASFITLVGQTTTEGVTDAEVYLGRGFQRTALTLPGLVIGGENVFYVRAVDDAGATSPLIRYPEPIDDGDDMTPPILRGFFIQPITSDLLLVNDYRSSQLPATNDETVMDFHRAVLRDRLGDGGTWDEWDLSETVLRSDAADFSEALATPVDPTLRQTLALWDRIYWVTNAATNSPIGNNLPPSASVMDLFFSEGGRLFVQTPVTQPLAADPTLNDGNAAINVLPLESLVTGSILRISRDPLTVREGVPGLGRALPPLEVTRTLSNIVPFQVGGTGVPLYDAPFFAPGGGTFDGPFTSVSMSQDARVALFGLDVVSTSTGIPLLAPPDAGDGDDPLTYCTVEDFTSASEPETLCDAINVILDGLAFPR